MNGLRAQHVDDLKRSGLSDYIIELAGLRSIDRQEATRILGFDPGSGGLQFPYPGLNGKAPSFLRVKPDMPFKDSSGRIAKYLTAKNAGNRLYIPPIYGEKDLRFQKHPVIVTEGEKKALAGAEKLPGFLVVALPGVWCFKTKDRPLIEDFGKINWRERSVYVAYDSDVVRKREVGDAEKMLALQLDRLGADVQICRIPESGNQKVGLDDFLLNHSPEAFVELVLDRAMLWTPRGNLEVDDLETFCSKSIPRQEQIVGGGVLPARGMLTIGGYSKMGKSVLAMNTGLCIAAGRAFLNQFPVPRPRRVLYLNEEISQQSMQDRAKKMRNSAKAEGFSCLRNFRLVSKTGIKLDSDEGLKTAMRLIRLHSPEVVIWDCLYRLHSLNENAATDMGRLMDKFDYLTRVFGVSHIIVHHFGNPQKDSDREGFQLLRGSSVIGAFGDSFLTLNPYKRNLEGNRYQKAIFTLRNAEAPEDLVISRNPETLWYEVVQVAEADSKLSIGNVVFTLKEMGGKAATAELYNRLSGVFEVSDRQARRVVAEAFKLNRIGRRQEGRMVEFYAHE